MNIFVGNLTLDTTESDLRELFQGYGSVDTVMLVRDRDSGYPRGVAFLEMPNDAEAERAIKVLNGTVLNERPMTVNEARPKREDLNGKAPVERRKDTRDTLDTRSHRKHRY